MTKTNALKSLVIAGFVRGLSVRDVEAALAEALGPQATVSKSTVSRICTQIKVGRRTSPTRRCARPGSAGTHGRAQRARRGCRQRNRTGDRHQGQLAACREAAGRLSSTDSRPRVAECGRGGDRRRRVAAATAGGARGAAGQFPHRIPTARSTRFPEARATAGRKQPVPGPGYGFTDGGRTPQPVVRPVR